MRIPRHFWLVTAFLLTFLPAQGLDHGLLKHINTGRNSGLDGLMKGISFSVYPVTAITPLSIWTSGVIIIPDSALRCKGFRAGVTTGISIGITLGLKYLVGRDRPYVTWQDLDPADHEPDPSFPSGHTTAAFATATGLTMTFPKWYVAVPAYSWAALVGYSRMHLGVHYPTDVLTGALIGTATGFLCFKANQWLARKP